MPTKLAYTINDLRAATGLGRTRIYELGAQGRLDFRKLDNRTLITAESARRLIKSLPVAEITTGQKRARDRQNSVEAAQARKRRSNK